MRITTTTARSCTGRQGSDDAEPAERRACSASRDGASWEDRSGPGGASVFHVKRCARALVAPSRRSPTPSALLTRTARYRRHPSELPPTAAV